MDGRILQEAIATTFQPLEPQADDAWTESNDDFGNDQGLTDDQKRVVAERLRGLGYVG